MRKHVPPSRKKIRLLRAPFLTPSNAIPRSEQFAPRNWRCRLLHARGFHGQIPGLVPWSRTCGSMSLQSEKNPLRRILRAISDKISPFKKSVLIGVNLWLNSSFPLHPEKYISSPLAHYPWRYSWNHSSAISHLWWPY